MGDSVDPTMLALLATLERRAKKNGEKSIVKSVIAELAAAGADDELIAEIATLGPKGSTGAKSPADSKSAGKGKTKASKTEVSESGVFVG